MRRNRGVDGVEGGDKVCPSRPSHPRQQQQKQGRGGRRLGGGELVRNLGRRQQEGRRVWRQRHGRLYRPYAAVVVISVSIFVFVVNSAVVIITVVPYISASGTASSSSSSSSDRGVAEYELELLPMSLPPSPPQPFTVVTNSGMMGETRQRLRIVPVVKRTIWTMTLGSLSLSCEILLLHHHRLYCVTYPPPLLHFR